MAGKRKLQLGFYLSVLLILVVSYLLVVRVKEGFAPASRDIYHIANSTAGPASGAVQRGPTRTIPASELTSGGQQLTNITFSKWNPSTRAWVPLTPLEINSNIDSTDTKVRFQLPGWKVAGTSISFLRKPTTTQTLGTNMVKLPISTGDSKLAGGITLTNLVPASFPGLSTTAGES
jgi:hypothetical protein